MADISTNAHFNLCYFFVLVFVLVVILTRPLELNEPRRRAISCIHFPRNDLVCLFENNHLITNKNVQNDPNEEFKTEREQANETEKKKLKMIIKKSLVLIYA